MDLPSRLDFFAIGREYVLQRAVRIDPDQVDTQGSDCNVFVGCASVLASAVIKQVAYELEGLLLDTATGEQLDRFAWDRYQEVRKGAAAALVYLAFTRPTFTAGEGTIASGALIGTPNGVQYATLEDASFGVTTLQLPSIRARAVQAGKDYQVGAGWLTVFAAAPFDTSITVTNPAAAAGGEDREDDDTFRDRLRGFWRAAQRGTKNAIEYGAKRVAGVESASAVEALGGDGQPARVVTLYFADSSGVATLAQAQAIAAELVEWRCCGIAVVMSLSSPQIVDVRLNLTFQAGIDTAALSSVVRAAVVEYVNSLGANQMLKRAALYSLLQRYESSGLDVVDGTIVEPAGDLVPAPGKTLRTTVEHVATA